MDESKDIRVELLLIIPVVWLILHLLPGGSGVQSERAADKRGQWEMSQIQFLPANLDQKEVLISLYELKNVPVNRANAELLATVPGIGPALAGRIVDERERSGFFHDPDDLTRVHGIGDRRAQQFQSYLRFD
jgi:competence ComEA-like helix-hairpin-helix protein